MYKLTANNKVMIKKQIEEPGIVYVGLLEENNMDKLNKVCSSIFTLSHTCPEQVAASLE